MIDDILKDAKIRMGKTAESLENELSRMRTGRAHPSLLESVKVDYYGAESPLSQVANVNIEDARMLTVTPWERSMVAAVEKAIINSNLGLNPNTAGTVIRVPVPPMTESAPWPPRSVSALPLPSIVSAPSPPYTVSL